MFIKNPEAIHIQDAARLADSSYTRLLSKIDKLKVDNFPSNPDLRVTKAEFLLAKFKHPEWFTPQQVGALESIFSVRDQKLPKLTIDRLRPQNPPDRKPNQKLAPATMDILDRPVYSGPKIDLVARLDKLILELGGYMRLRAEGKFSAEEFVQLIQEDFAFMHMLNQDHINMAALRRPGALEAAGKDTLTLIGMLNKLATTYLNDGHNRTMASWLHDMVRVVDTGVRQLLKNKVLTEKHEPTSLLAKESPDVFLVTQKGWEEVRWSTGPAVIPVMVHGGTTASGVIRAMAAPGDGDTSIPSHGDSPVSHLGVLIRDDKGEFGAVGEWYVLEWLIGNGGKLKSLRELYGENNPGKYLADNAMSMGQTLYHPDYRVQQAWVTALEAGALGLAREVKHYMDTGQDDKHLYNFEFGDDPVKTHCSGQMKRIFEHEDAQKMIKGYAEFYGDQAANDGAETHRTISGEIKTFNNLLDTRSSFQPGEPIVQLLVEDWEKPADIVTALMPGDITGAGWQPVFMSWAPEKVDESIFRDAMYSGLLNHMMSKRGFAIQRQFLTTVMAWGGKIARWLVPPLLKDKLQPNTPVGAIATILDFEDLEAYMLPFLEEQEQQFKIERKRRGLTPRPLSFEEKESLIIKHIENQLELRRLQLYHEDHRHQDLWKAREYENMITMPFDVFDQMEELADYDEYGRTPEQAIEAEKMAAKEQQHVYPVHW